MLSAWSRQVLGWWLERWSLIQDHLTDLGELGIGGLAGSPFQLFGEFWIGPKPEDNHGGYVPDAVIDDEKVEQQLGVDGFGQGFVDDLGRIAGFMDAQGDGYAKAVQFFFLVFGLAREPEDMLKMDRHGHSFPFVGTPVCFRGREVRVDAAEQIQKKSISKTDICPKADCERTVAYYSFFMDNCQLLGLTYC